MYWRAFRNQLHSNYTRVTRTNRTSFSIPGLCQRGRRTNWPDSKWHPTSAGFCMGNLVFDVLLLRVAHFSLLDCVRPRKVLFWAGKLILMTGSIPWSALPFRRIVCLLHKPLECELASGSSRGDWRLYLCVLIPPGGGGGVLIIFLGGGVPPGPENPYPISDQNIRFSIPYFRPDYQNVYPISDPVMCDKFGNSEWIYGVRDVRDAQTMFVSFSSRSMSTATHVTLKVASQTKQTEYTPYFRPKWQNLYPISD